MPSPYAAKAYMAVQTMYMNQTRTIYYVWILWKRYWNWNIYQTNNCWHPQIAHLWYECIWFAKLKRSYLETCTSFQDKWRTLSVILCNPPPTPPPPKPLKNERRDYWKCGSVMWLSIPLCSHEPKILDYFNKKERKGGNVIHLALVYALAPLDNFKDINIILKT